MLSLIRKLFTRFNLRLILSVTLVALLAVSLLASCASTVRYEQIDLGCLLIPTVTASAKDTRRTQEEVLEQWKVRKVVCNE